MPITRAQVRSYDTVTRRMDVLINGVTAVTGVQNVFRIGESPSMGRITPLLEPGEDRLILLADNDYGPGDHVAVLLFAGSWLVLGRLPRDPLPAVEPLDPPIPATGRIYFDRILTTDEYRRIKLLWGKRVWIRQIRITPTNPQQAFRVEIHDMEGVLQAAWGDTDVAVPAEGLVDDAGFFFESPDGYLRLLFDQAGSFRIQLLGERFE